MDVLKIIARYIRFFFRSKHWSRLRHNEAHSLLKRIIEGTHVPAQATVIERRRTVVMDSKETIDVTDLGAGSLTLNSRSQKVGDIARRAMTPKKEAEIFFRLAALRQPTVILELGTSLGITTMYLASSSPGVRVVTIEGDPAKAAIAGKNFESAGFTNIDIHVGNFDDLLPSVLASVGSLGLVLFDGNHRKEPTLRYFQQCLPLATPQTVFVIDDMYWSAEMEEAWVEIKRDPHVTGTIDLFHYGLVFFDHSVTGHHSVRS